MHPSLLLVVAADAASSNIRRVRGWADTLLDRVALADALDGAMKKRELPSDPLTESLERAGRFASKRARDHVAGEWRWRAALDERMAEVVENTSNRECQALDGWLCVR